MQLKIYEAVAMGRDYYKGFVKLAQGGRPSAFYVLSVVHESAITEFAEHTAWGLRHENDTEHTDISCVLEKGAI